MTLLVWDQYTDRELRDMTACGRPAFRLDVQKELRRHEETRQARA